MASTTTVLRRRATALHIAVEAQGGASNSTGSGKATTRKRAQLGFLSLHRKLRVLKPLASPNFRAKPLHPLGVIKENAGKGHNRAQRIYCGKKIKVANVACSVFAVTSLPATTGNP